jgi:two-component system sporulation sensor kinase A
MEKRYNIQITHSLDDGIIVFGNSRKLVLLFENLLLNAFEAVMECGEKKVHISSWKENGNANIRFDDSGKGIPFCFGCGENNCVRCGKFWLGRSTRENGTGMGMVLVFETVREMDGRLKIETRADSGTSVQVILPLPA